MTSEKEKEFRERSERIARAAWPSRYQAPMLPNTLRNSDGTPYRAGYDEPVIEQIRKRAKNALDTGHTWPVQDRLNSLEEVLKDIIVLCDKEMQSQ